MRMPADCVCDSYDTSYLDEYMDEDIEDDDFCPDCDELWEDCVCDDWDDEIDDIDEF